MEDHSTVPLNKKSSKFSQVKKVISLGVNKRFSVQHMLNVIYNNIDYKSSCQIIL